MEGIHDFSRPERDKDGLGQIDDCVKILYNVSWMVKKLRYCWKRLKNSFKFTWNDRETNAFIYKDPSTSFSFKNL